MLLDGTLGHLILSTRSAVLTASRGAVAISAGPRQDTTWRVRNGQGIVPIADVARQVAVDRAADDADVRPIACVDPQVAINGNGGAQGVIAVAVAQVQSDVASDEF